MNGRSGRAVIAANQHPAGIVAGEFEAIRSQDGIGCIKERLIVVRQMLYLRRCKSHSLDDPCQSLFQFPALALISLRIAFSFSFHSASMFRVGKP